MFCTVFNILLSNAAGKGILWIGVNIQYVRKGEWGDNWLLIIKAPKTAQAWDAAHDASGITGTIHIGWELIWNAVWKNDHRIIYNSHPCSLGFASVSKEQIDSRTFEMVSAGLHWSLRMSRQIWPLLLDLNDGLRNWFTELQIRWADHSPVDITVINPRPELNLGSLEYIAP